MKRANRLNRRNRRKVDEIDRLVTIQADDKSAWEKPLTIRRPKSKSLLLPARLAARAGFFARLHGETRLEKWVEQIVKERVEIEEAAFSAAKKSLAS